MTDAGPTQFRWVLVLYHAAEEIGRYTYPVWFDTMDSCKADAKSRYTSPSWFGTLNACKADAISSYTSPDWFGTMDACKADAKDYNFDYCCGFDFLFESRNTHIDDVKPPCL